MSSIFHFGDLHQFFSWTVSTFNLIASSNAVGIHFLMCPLCVWQHVESKMLSLRCKREPFWTLFWSSIFIVKFFIILMLSLIQLHSDVGCSLCSLWWVFYVRSCYLILCQNQVLRGKHCSSLRLASRNFLSSLLLTNVLRQPF